jgi:hypothetical protein
LTDFYQQSHCNDDSNHVYSFLLYTKHPSCYHTFFKTTARRMARLKVARALILILLLICGIAGYIVHILLQRYTINPPLASLYTAEQNTATQLKKHANGFLPLRNDTHKDIQVGRAKDEVENLVFGQDGLVRNWEDGQGIKGYSKRSSRVRYNHPIYRLIDEGQAKWAKLLER